MNSVKILCCGLSNMLFEIVEASFGNSDTLTILGNVETLSVDRYLTEDTWPNFVILEAEGSPDYLDILYQFPKVKVIVIEKNGRNIDLWHLLPYRKSFGEISSDELAKVFLSITTERH